MSKALFTQIWNFHMCQNMSCRICMNYKNCIKYGISRQSALHHEHPIRCYDMIITIENVSFSMRWTGKSQSESLEL